MTPTPYLYFQYQSCSEKFVPAWIKTRGQRRRRTETLIGSFPKYKKRNLSQKTHIHKKPKPSNGLTYVTHAFMTQFRTARAQFRLAFACSASFRGQSRNRLLVETATISIPILRGRQSRKRKNKGYQIRILKILSNLQSKYDFKKFARG